MNKQPIILEDTFRDSLYITDFLIESETLVTYVQALLKAGFTHLEIGHSLGLGAYRTFSSGFSDQELFEALGSLLTEHPLMAFFIPGIGDLDDARLARQHGLYGIRVGMHAHEVPERLQMLKSLKEMGYFVCLNLMKTYAYEPLTFANYLKGCEPWVDVVYLVDSAGCMWPEQLRAYAQALKQTLLPMPELGFHGHNNLGLAVSNALAMLDEGALFIDTTLGGIGRSGGNIPTETLLAVFNKLGIYSDEELLLQTLDLSEQYRLYLKDKGRVFTVNEVDILYGYSCFHSSFEAKARSFAEDEALDYHRFIVEVCRRDRLNLSPELLQAAAQAVRQQEAQNGH